jgi:hypothetical protein
VVREFAASLGAGKGARATELSLVWPRTEDIRGALEVRTRGPRCLNLMDGRRFADRKVTQRCSPGGPSRIVVEVFYGCSARHCSCVLHVWQGWAAGGAVPCSAKNMFLTDAEWSANKPKPFLKQRLHRFNGTPWGRCVLRGKGHSSVVRARCVFNGGQRMFRTDLIRLARRPGGANH